MLFSWFSFNKHTRTVRRQISTNNPPEVRAEYNTLRSLRCPKWRILMMFTSAYCAEANAAEAEGRSFDLDRYIRLIANAGNYPDGYTEEDVQEVLKHKT